MSSSMSVVRALVSFRCGFLILGARSFLKTHAGVFRINSDFRKSSDGFTNCLAGLKKLGRFISCSSETICADIEPIRSNAETAAKGRTLIGRIQIQKLLRPIQKLRTHSETTRSNSEAAADGFGNYSVGFRNRGGRIRNLFGRFGKLWQSDSETTR